VRLSHAANKTDAVFDDEHVIAHGGLVPVMRLAERCRLPGLIAEHVRVIDRLGVNSPAKVSSIVAGMTAGADSIDDMDLLRHGGMTKVFAGVRAPSTLGSFLRCLKWGNVRQIEKVSRELLARLAAHTPLLPGADVLAFVDIDSTQKRVYGPGKQGAGFGHTKIQGKSVLIRGLNALAAVVSTPLAAPVIAATRLRAGTTNSARGAASLITEGIGVARRAGATGPVLVRGDSAFYSAACVHACLRQDTFFSFTVKMDPKVKATIAMIEESAWTPIEYPHAIFDEQSGTWVSNAEIAEIDYTAFASKKTKAVTARLIVRRVRRLDNAQTAGQQELLPAWRYHAVFTNSLFTLPQAESQHRDHAIIEQVFADLSDGPLAHLPSGSFAANAAWLTLAAIAHNLLRASGCLASAFHAKARGQTLRRHLINVPARIARHGHGHLTLHLPAHWPWADTWTTAFTRTHGPPQPA
jgi:Transposase DDE domain group 1